MLKIPGGLLNITAYIYSHLQNLKSALELLFK